MCTQASTDAKIEEIERLNAAKKWRAVVEDDLKPTIDNAEKAVRHSLTLNKILGDQISGMGSKDPYDVNAISIPVFNEVCNLLIWVKEPYIGTMLERSVKMVQRAYLRFQEANKIYTGLCRNIDTVTEEWSQGNLVVPIEDMQELFTERVRQINVLLNSVSVEKDGK